jgi:hypothetical protein
MAILPTVQNAVELEHHLLDALRDRLVAAGYLFLSTLIEERILDAGPEWLRHGTVLQRVENYLRSGMAFVYLQVPLRAVSS